MFFWTNIHGIGSSNHICLCKIRSSLNEKIFLALSASFDLKQTEISQESTLAEHGYYPRRPILTFCEAYPRVGKASWSRLNSLRPPPRPPRSPPPLRYCWLPWPRRSLPPPRGAPRLFWFWVGLPVPPETARLEKEDYWLFQVSKNSSKMLDLIFYISSKNLPTCLRSFLKVLITSKRHFEINWPLVRSIVWSWHM